MKNKKKALARTVVVLCLCVLCMTLTAMVISRYNAKLETRNVITTGDVDIELTTFGYRVDDDSGTYALVSNPSPAVTVLPGVDIPRDATVRNLDEAAYIRVRFVLKFYDAQGNEVPLAVAGAPFTVTMRQDMTSVEANKWVKDGDWFYFTGDLGAGTGVVPTGSTIGALSVNITAASDMGNEYNGAGYTAKLTAEAQAVQWKNQNNVNDVLNVLGWPAES